MDSMNIITILLFILPGILAEKISYKIDFPTKERETDFKEIINGILFSLPIIFLAWIICSKINGLLTLNEFIISFDDLKFLDIFSILVFIMTIILGIFKSITRYYIYNIINVLRKNQQDVN